MNSLQAYLGMGHALLIQPVETSMELLQWLHQGLLSPLDLRLMLLRIDDFCISSLFDVEQLVGPHPHFFHLKGATVLIKSEFTLCFDSSVVAPPQSLLTFANPCHLSHLPKTLSSKSARGPHLLMGLLVNRLDCCLLCVWAGKAIPSHWILIRDGSTHLWLTAWVWLLNALVGFVFTDAPSRVSVMVSSAPWGLYNHPIIRVSSVLGWTRGQVDELGLRVFRAGASSWLGSIDGPRLGRWKDALTTGINFCGLRMVPFATLIIKCAVRRAVLLLVFRTDGKLE